MFDILVYTFNHYDKGTHINALFMQALTNITSYLVMGNVSYGKRFWKTQVFAIYFGRNK